jgi:hypothetical protein
MMTLEERLTAIVALLPAGASELFNAPPGPGETTDTRLADAVRALAKAEGLVCMTPGEFSRAAMQDAAQRFSTITKPPAQSADEKTPAALSARFAAITDPRAQTAFWRSLTVEQRAAVLNAK